MSGENISIFLAFAAGVLSFLSPCVLPLVPAYLGHLAGVTVQAKTDSTYNRNIIINRHGAVQRPRAVRVIVVSHALAFVLGFSLGFYWCAGLFVAGLHPLCPTTERPGTDCLRTEHAGGLSDWLPLPHH